MKKGKLDKKCSKLSHKVYNILFPTMFICGFFFWSHCVRAMLSLTSTKRHDKWLLLRFCHPQPQAALLKMWRKLPKFSMTSQDRQPSRMRSEGWGKDHGWVLPSGGWAAEDRSEILSLGHCCIIISAQLPVFSSFVWELVSLPFILGSWE